MGKWALGLLWTNAYFTIVISLPFNWQHCLPLFPLPTSVANLAENPLDLADFAPA